MKQRGRAKKFKFNGVNFVKLPRLLLQSAHAMSTSLSIASVVTQALPQWPIAPGERRWLGNLKGALDSFVLAQCVWQQPDAPIIMVARDQTHVNLLEAELQFFEVPVFVFPDWETLPYDRLSPHKEISSERLALLFHMPKNGVILLAASTLLQRLAPPSWLLGQHFDLKKGQVFKLEEQRHRLSMAGYRAVDSVFEAGEYAVRGSLMDIYPMGQTLPVRIELFDDSIESLRLFDPETQRTKPDGQIERFTLLPAREFPLLDGKSTFRMRFSELFPHASVRKVPLYQDVMDGIATPGIEYYQALFFEETDYLAHGTLFSYFPRNSVIVTDALIDAPMQHYWSELQRRYEDRRHNIDQPVVPPHLLALTLDETFARFKDFGRLILSQDPAPERAGAFNLPAVEYPVLTVEQNSPEPLAHLKQFVQTFSGVIVLVAESAGRRESLRDLLRPVFGNLTTLEQFGEVMQRPIPQTGIKNRLNIATAGLERGLILPERCALITENQLFGQRVIQKRRRKSGPSVSDEFLVKSLAELSIGVPIVHVDYGVGRYQGLVTLEVDGQEHELMQINYAENAVVYVPVANLHLISRYSAGDPEHAPLHRLGSDVWARAKRKAIAQIYDVAAELLNVQARRAARPGIAFNIDEQAYRLFASQFPFEETHDQRDAIEATLADMAAARPMDRLVCGDVGFGKTEVAMRAAFVAVHGGKQVAILVPTTLLAQQHYDNFLDRFADWPVRIEVLSRFGKKSDHDKVLKDLAAGTVDIVIGTHKLLQETVKFHDLGLMIVDEEHRFGVRDKEKIKNMRADVDMLTLTATPIPRTLNMAFSGMRDFSIIATPPARRLAVKTFVMERSNATLKEAILRELLRGGQVYFLHNDVASIERAAEALHALIPEARVGIAHGQMREQQLEQVMQAFYHKQYNILVSSTIIETGIDVPSANTIIIERADKLGLAQLHQLRGRVGRSHHQAYAYLLVPSLKHLKGDAEKRLEAITRASDLGAGFILASEDLEIRGAGELLGEEQSGNMQAIGFSMYMDMLERATRAIQNGQAPNLEAPLTLTADIRLHLPARIPDEYLNDVHQRLLFYKRISAVQDLGALDQLRIEMIDRFGLLPTVARHLFEVHYIRLLAGELGICKIDISAQGGSIEFSPETPVAGLSIIKLIQGAPNAYKMEGGQRLRILQTFATEEARLAFVKQLLEHLMRENGLAAYLEHAMAPIEDTRPASKPRRKKR